MPMLPDNPTADTHLDLSPLAIDRGERSRRTGTSPLRLVTRYVLPGAILLGFASLIVWSARDWLQPPRPVTVVPVLALQAERRQEGTPLFPAAGWVEPRPTAVRVPALVEGVVQELLVVQDQPVQAGQVIARLVDDDARLGLEQAQAAAQLRAAELQEAQAELTAATTRLKSPLHLQAALAEAEAQRAVTATAISDLPFQIQRAQTSEELARRILQGRSAAGEAVSTRSRDQAQADLEAATSHLLELQSRQEKLQQQQAAVNDRCRALEQQLELKADERRDCAVAAARVAAAEARVRQAEVAVQEARLRLERMTIRAPLEARVLHLVAEPGTMLTPGKGHSETHDGSTVVTLYRPESLQIRVDVRFEDLPKVSPGQPVQVVSPAAEEPLSGRVLLVTSVADIQKNTLEVKIGIDALPTLLKPEMLVQVTFLAPALAASEMPPPEEHRLFLPADLIHRADQGSFVWLADRAAGAARRTAVQTGPATGSGLVEVTAGLTLTSRVIAGAEGLRDGQRIRIVEEE